MLCRASSNAETCCYNAPAAAELRYCLPLAQLLMVAENLKASLQPGSPAEILLYRTHQQLQASTPHALLQRPAFF